METPPPTTTFNKPFSKHWRSLAFLWFFTIIILYLYLLIIYPFQKTQAIPSSATHPTPSPAHAVSSWPLYQNPDYQLSFHYPPYLTIESQDSDYSLLRVHFIGKECLPTPPMERGHIPTVEFIISQSSQEPPAPDRCSQQISPNVRCNDLVGPIPLSNGLEATLTRTFGVSGDGTNLTVTSNHLNYSFTTGSGPVPCADRYKYHTEIFQMASSLTLPPPLSSSPTSSVPISTENWQTHTDNAYGFSIQYPSSFFLNPNPYFEGQLFKLSNSNSFEDDEFSLVISAISQTASQAKDDSNRQSQILNQIGLSTLRQQFGPGTKGIFLGDPPWGYYQIFTPFTQYPHQGIQLTVRIHSSDEPVNGGSYQHRDLAKQILTTFRFLE